MYNEMNLIVPRKFIHVQKNFAVSAKKNSKCFLDIRDVVLL